MKNKLDMGVYRIYFRGTITQKDKFLIIKSYNFIKKFFNTSLPKFDLVFVDSRKEFDRIFSRKTPKYVISFVNRKGITIFSPETIEKETCWKRSDFYSTMIHEMSHLFFRKMAGKNVPIWLNEGLATYLQNNQNSPKNTSRISYLELKRKHNFKKPINYDAYWKFVSFLLKKYKKEKMMKILKNIGKKRDIERLFKEAYNKNLKDLVKDANNQF